MAGKLTCVNIEVTQAAATVAPAIAGADTTWKTATGIKYRKFPDGTVEVRLTTSLSQGNFTGAMAAGYRPSDTLYWAAGSLASASSMKTRVVPSRWSC